MTVICKQKRKAFSIKSKMANVARADASEKTYSISNVTCTYGPYIKKINKNKNKKMGTGQTSCSK
jgi:hypothetical protein